MKASLARQLRHVANARDTHLQSVSARLVRGHVLIVLEDLRIAGMTRSAAGMANKPGTNVAQKRALNRSILDTGRGRLVGMVRCKAGRAGGEPILVHARNTSLTCSGCGTVAPKPLSLRRHACACACGLDVHRDENAARVILARGLAAAAAGEGGLPLGHANVGRRAVRRPGTLLAA